ncbi:hypothetical protein [Evansella tamaricis]|uniref:Uncharacterized protein n=1 Tax=Evansella tamaricis TaxID=2069301 RepID=A0ABS6JLF0_9BACI|nr:hypothetical protein [Evansella tamaricis]MBU9714416.1 hypothetical protein [Evansella tamaricis]
MKDVKKVTVAGQKVEIRKFTMRKFAELMLALEHLPGKLKGQFTKEELESFSNEQLLTKFPLLFATAQDDVFELVSVASGVDKELLNNADPVEFMGVIETILELNNVKAIVDKVKNLITVLRNKK